MTAATNTQSGQATIVILVDVAEGREADYRTWQERMNAAAAEFPGFVACETIPPTSGIQDSWTEIFRFRSADELSEWLESDARRDLLEEGGDFATDKQQYAMSGGSNADDSGFTLVASHKVTPGHEKEFVDLQKDFEDAQHVFPGYRGGELLRPVPGVQDEWTSLARFDTRADVETWIESPERKVYLERLEGMVEDFDVTVVGSSFGSWFSFNMVDGKATPNWKQWLAVLLALYPTVMLLAFLTDRAPGGVKSSIPAADWFFANMWIGNFLSTLALTFLIMPLVTRGFRFWLRPDARLRASIVGTLVVVALFAASLLIFGATCPSGC